jgi:hypothetical protein
MIELYLGGGALLRCLIGWRVKPTVVTLDPIVRMLLDVVNTPGSSSSITRAGRDHHVDQQRRETLHPPKQDDVTDLEPPLSKEFCGSPPAGTRTPRTPTTQAWAALDSDGGSGSVQTLLLVVLDDPLHLIDAEGQIAVLDHRLRQETIVLAST